MKNIKKKVAFIMTLVFVISGSQLTYAQDLEKSNMVSSKLNVNEADEVALFLNEASNNINQNTELSNLWEDAIEEDYIYMDVDGHLKINTSKTTEGLGKYEVFENELSNWNLALDLQVLKWDADSQKLYTPEITGEIIENVTKILVEKKADILINEVMPTSVAHNCNYENWNVDSTCSQNYNTIKSFYNSMLAAQQAGTNVDPWLSTATYWVGLVREDGLWDYKVQKNYATFCCVIGGVSGQDRSAEWIGNYNYGYTGKFLFDLHTLHKGSYVVSGMDPKDKTTDWPAIDKGYANAP